MRTLLSFALLLVLFPAGAQVRLPRLISDGMVLQRETPIKLWGWASPGEAVTLTFQSRQYKAVTSGDGQWTIALPAQRAGGPHELTFTGNNTLTVKDVLFGDVWLCSGQSNMELTMERVRYKYPMAVATANNPAIRQFEVPDRYDFQQPAVDLAAGRWTSLTPQTIPRFSAVAYFFADELYRTYGVPIGLINAALGGSPAEAWISEGALKAFPRHYAEAQRFKDASLITQIEAADRKVQNAWYSALGATDEGLKHRWASAALDDTGWATMHLPGYWGDGPLGPVNGAVWFRKEVELPRAVTGEPGYLQLGRIVDADSVFVNGTFVGTTTYQYPPRRYNLPAGLLREGRNLIAVRVVSNAGRGGFVPGKPYELVAGGHTTDLKGPWSYKLGARMDALPGQTFVRWKPVGLYNAMIAPLVRYPIKGVAWYQGESNTGAPGEYAALMQALIEDWRAQWGQGTFPFLLVQLPNFMEPSDTPMESNWAALRQAQLQTLSVPNTGLAVAIDAGEWNDIHPLDKQTIGHRLALQARRLAYGDKKIAAGGPLYRSLRREGTRLAVSFTGTGSGLTTTNGKAPAHFALAGDDGKFHWAQTALRGNTVVVWSKAVPHPVAVRYAWADNPAAANLQNREGLPASPFEARLESTAAKKVAR